MVMRQVNVPIEEPVYERAKDCARHAGMLFRKWVERAIDRQAGIEAHDRRQSSARKRVAK